ncbi:hypothetical protein HZA55_08670 [Candidatus Poribacteria bacterium]|nr:hypothetical protein [Candidatus Poribacteria bacterium]
MLINKGDIFLETLPIGHLAIKDRKSNGAHYTTIIRIISSRKATKNEQEQYYKE